VPKAATVNATPPMPADAAPPSARALEQLTESIRAQSPPSAPVAAYLSQDWDTQGDWIGRYGRQAAYWPSYGRLANNRSEYILHEVRPGPHNKNAGGPFYYFHSLASSSPNAMYGPLLEKRVIGEWNDGGWQADKFGMNFQGPDLWLDVSVPPGLSRVSLYIYNIGNNGGDDRWRDYTIELKNYVPSQDEAQHAPVLAVTRVPPAEDAAYRTFLLSGGRYLLRVASNYSQMAMVSAVYFDRIGASNDPEDEVTARYLSGVPYDPPDAPARSESEPPALRAARDLWDALDAGYSNANIASLQFPYRHFAYRAAAANGASADLLANWRWTLHLWTPEDRAEWERVMAKSREARRAKQSAATQAMSKR
jgi:hypothetical protein